MKYPLKLSPLSEQGFGGVIDVDESAIFYQSTQENPEWLSEAMDISDGLLLIKGLSDIVEYPERLVELSYLFGNEVENYLDTPTPRNMIHNDVGEILVISNRPPYDRQPPVRPDPPTTESGGVPVQFPHLKGWHTDQSFRRPPPDVSLFYGVEVTPHGQGQTLFANGYAAYKGLSDELKKKIEGVSGLHALLGTGRSRQAVQHGLTAMELLPHQQSQPQPIVRIHPVTKHPALYLVVPEEPEKATYTV